MHPQPFSLRQLQYAVAVADSRGFRRAAARCHVSQPALSAQLAQLETVLGARLFERSRRQILLTAAGEELVERARGLLADADALVTAAHRFRDPLVGTLRVGVIPTMSPYWLPALVPRLRERYPRLTLVWSEDKTVSVLRDLGAGRLDAVLVAHVSGMEDFEREMLEAELTATSLFTLTQMVAGSAAITLLPQLALAVERRRSALAIRRFAAPVPGRTLVLAWRRQSPFRAALRALAGAMRAPAAARPHSREPGAPRTTRPVRVGHRMNGGHR